MSFIGIVGARKFKDRQTVEKLIVSLPGDSIIVTSGCDGVCTWTQSKAKGMNFEVLVYSPDLSNIRSWFDVPKRYYKRNRELIERCDLVHAFISRDGGYTGGTRFEIEYAVKLNIPVKVHWEKGMKEVFFQPSLPFQKEIQPFGASWQKFFCEAAL